MLAERSFAIGRCQLVSLKRYYFQNHIKLLFLILTNIDRDDHSTLTPTLEAIDNFFTTKYVLSG